MEYAVIEMKANQIWIVVWPAGADEILITHFGMFARAILQTVIPIWAIFHKESVVVRIRLRNWQKVCYKDEDETLKGSFTYRENRNNLRSKRGNNYHQFVVMVFDDVT